jgi:putative transposase
MKQNLNPAVARVLKRLHYPLDVILISPKGTSFGACVRWYVAYALSLRNLEEMMAERGIAVDQCWRKRFTVTSEPSARAGVSTRPTLR